MIASGSFRIWSERTGSRQTAHGARRRVCMLPSKAARGIESSQPGSGIAGALHPSRENKERSPRQRHAAAKSCISACAGGSLISISLLLINPGAAKNSFAPGESGVAARLGFEPRLGESKSPVLPLHHRAKGAGMWAISAVLASAARRELVIFAGGRVEPSDPDQVARKRLCPVISAGWGTPSRWSRDGATSARMPLSSR